MGLRVEFPIFWGNHVLDKESKKDDKKYAMHQNIIVVSYQILLLIYRTLHYLAHQIADLQIED